MRNDRQGRRIEIGGKDCERGGDQPGDDDPDCVGKEHRQDIIHLQGIILLLAGSCRRCARALTLCTFSLFPFIFLPLFLHLLLILLLFLLFLYLAAGKIAVRNRCYHCSVDRGREKDPARNLRENKGAAIGAAAPRTEAG